MSDDWGVPDDDEDEVLELPALDTEAGRDGWVELLAQQDEESITANGGWIHMIIVTDEKPENGVMRVRYADGTEDIFDIQIRRKIGLVTENDSERN
jgi:hypothetical protein